MATSDAGPGYDVVKGYKIPVSNNDTFGAFMTSHALQFLFFMKTPFPFITIHRKSPNPPNLITDSQFIRSMLRLIQNTVFMYEILKITFCHFRASVNMDRTELSTSF